MRRGQDGRSKASAPLSRNWHVCLDVWANVTVHYCQQEAVSLLPSLLLCSSSCIFPYTKKKIKGGATGGRKREVFCWLSKLSCMMIRERAMGVTGEAGRSLHPQEHFAVRGVGSTEPTGHSHVHPDRKAVEGPEHPTAPPTRFPQHPAAWPSQGSSFPSCLSTPCPSAWSSSKGLKYEHSGGKWIKPAGKQFFFVVFFFCYTKCRITPAVQSLQL